MKKKPKVKLIGENGNAFSIIGKVSLALKKAGYTKEEVKDYQSKAMASDYNNLLSVTASYVEIT